MNRGTINISVSRETHQRLKERGKKGDSFDTIIKALLDNADNSTHKKNEKR